MIGLMKKAWHVYTLSDPRTNEVRYVGCSGQIHKRLMAHISEAKNRESEGSKNGWIFGLAELGMEPILDIVESGSGDNWPAVEIKWIQLYQTKGCDLTNVRYAKLSEENVALIREALSKGAAPATIARFFDVSRQMIGQIRDNQNWK